MAGALNRLSQSRRNRFNFCLKRSAGELLKQVELGISGSKLEDGTGPHRKTATAEAGLSDRQAKTAQSRAKKWESQSDSFVRLKLI